MPPLAERIERTDKNDNGFVQVVIVRTCRQEVGINHRLVVARTLEKTFPFKHTNLHFDVVYCISIVAHIDIHANTLALVACVHGFFCFQIVDVLDFHTENSLQQVQAYPFDAHDEFEHVIILNRQVFPRLDAVHLPHFLICIILHFAAFRQELLQQQPAYNVQKTNGCTCSSLDSSHRKIPKKIGLLGDFHFYISDCFTRIRHLSHHFSSLCHKLRELVREVHGIRQIKNVDNFFCRTPSAISHIRR